MWLYQPGARVGRPSSARVKNEAHLQRKCALLNLRETRIRPAPGSEKASHVVPRALVTRRALREPERVRQLDLDRLVDFVGGMVVGGLESGLSDRSFFAAEGTKVPLLRTYIIHSPRRHLFLTGSLLPTAGCSFEISKRVSNSQQHRQQQQQQMTTTTPRTSSGKVSPEASDECNTNQR